MNDAPEEGDIVLDVRGQSFVIALSTLLSRDDPSYFTARFRPGSMLDPGQVRVDDEGRKVYELDHDPALFRHVAEYLRTGGLPECIGRWAANKILWDGLRQEAEYFGLDGLVKLLTVAFSCAPDDEDGRENKGILYWLGTKKGTAKYRNPLKRGHVWVQGLWERYDDDWYEGPDERTEKAYFFQFRPNEEGALLTQECIPPSDVSSGNKGFVDYDDLWSGESPDAKGAFRNNISGGMGLFILSGCDACRTGTAGKDPVVISFKNGLEISPTHYSIRNAGCYGMSGDWDFAGSADGGKTWTVLHRQRGKSPLYGGIGGDKSDLSRDEEWRKIAKIRAYLRGFEDEAREEAICDYFERTQRHTFELDSPSADFFTHFRFISVLTYTSDKRKEFCIHGVGFEIWGDAREGESEGQDSSCSESDEDSSVEESDDDLVEVEQSDDEHGNAGL